MIRMLKNQKNQLFIMLGLTIICIAFIYSIEKTFTIVIDGKATTYITFRQTLGKALENENILVDSKDKISKSLNSKLVKNEVITIKKAMNIVLDYDNKEHKVKSAEENIDSMLKAEGIKVNDQDKISPQKDIKLSENLKVKIVRVEVRDIKEIVPIDFDTVVKNDDNMGKAQSKTLEVGEKGEKHLNYSVIYDDGKEVSRKLTSEVVAKKPKNQIVAKGTLNQLNLNRGDPVLYKNMINVKSTAYYAVNGVGRTYTASGRLAVRDSNGYSTIAVDPRVIPLGTRVYVEGYGLAIAADKGTAIIGNFIDVFFNTYREACNWEVKYVKVYILK